MKKRIPIVILVAICMIGSMACNKEEIQVSASSKETVLTSESSVTLQETIPSVMIDTDTIDEEYAWQFQVIYDNTDIWKRSEDDELASDWYCRYSIMDLDQDGLLEVCKCAQYDNGPVNEFWIFEVTSDSCLVELESELGSDVCPDLLYEPEWYFNEEDGVYRYLLRDCESYGIEGVFYHYGFLSIRDDRIVFETLYTYSLQNSEDGSVGVYYDGEGNEINGEEYKSLYDESVSRSKDRVFIGWFGEDEIDSDHIEDSFKTFLEKKD